MPTDRSVIMEQRQGLLQFVRAQERALGYTLTTAEMRLWFKHFGPTEATAKKEVDELKAAKKERQP